MIKCFNSAIRRFTILKILICCSMLILVSCSGCMRVPLAAAGNKDENTKGGAVYYGTYYDFWWGESPEETLLKFMKTKRHEHHPRSLYQVMYSSNYLYTLVSFVSLGFCVPLDVRWYLIALPAEEYNGPIRKKKTERL